MKTVALPAVLKFEYCLNLWVGNSGHKQESARRVFLKKYKQIRMNEFVRKVAQIA